MIKKCKKGFTLVEIIAVISLILIISSIAMPMYNKVVDRQKLKTDASTALQLSQIAKTYYIENKGKPNAKTLDKYIEDIYGSIPVSKYNGSTFKVTLDSSNGKVDVSIEGRQIVNDGKLTENYDSIP